MKLGHFFNKIMSDIQTREDLHLLMSEFYLKLLADSKISYIFIKVAKIDLVPHLEELVDFWNKFFLKEACTEKMCSKFTPI